MSEEYEPIKGIANGSKSSSQGDSMLKAFLSMFSSGVEEREKDPDRPQTLSNNDEPIQNDSSQQEGVEQQSEDANHKDKNNSSNNSENGAQQSDQQSQSGQSENESQSEGLNEGGSEKNQTQASSKDGETQTKSEGVDGGSSKKQEEKGGFFSNYFHPIMNRLKIRKIRKNTKKDMKKNSYHQHHILRNHARFMANREESVQRAKDKFDDVDWDKLDLYFKMNSTNNVKKVEALEKKYEMKKVEQQTKAQLLKAELLKADIRRAIEGPRGCLKDAIGCAKLTKMICLTVVGGAVISTILKLCGIF